METGHFYFISDLYFETFPDDKLMKNKGVIAGLPHSRPCFFSFQDERSGIYWLVPISSKVEKYRAVYQKKISRYGKCDTLVFGEVVGQPAAFLIQNMCPITPKYITEEFRDKQSNRPVRISGNMEAVIIKRAKNALALIRKGIKLIFPDVLQIERQLLIELQSEKDLPISLSDRLVAAKELSEKENLPTNRSHDQKGVEK